MNESKSSSTIYKLFTAFKVDPGKIPRGMGSAFLEVGKCRTLR